MFTQEYLQSLTHGQLVALDHQLDAKRSLYGVISDKSIQIQEELIRREDQATTEDRG